MQQTHARGKRNLLFAPRPRRDAKTNAIIQANPLYKKYLFSLRFRFCMRARAATKRNLLFAPRPRRDANTNAIHQANPLYKKYCFLLRFRFACAPATRQNEREHQHNNFETCENVCNAKAKNLISPSSKTSKPSTASLPSSTLTHNASKN